MAHLKYYQDERNRYPNLNIPLTEEEMNDVVPKMFKHFGFHSCPVLKVVPAKKVYSTYSPGAMLMTPRLNAWDKPDVIKMAPTMMNWRMVAHEAAHALQCREFDQEWCEAFRHGRREPRAEAWHNGRHRRWMDAVVQYLVDFVFPETTQIYRVSGGFQVMTKSPGIAITRECDNVREAASHNGENMNETNDTQTTQRVSILLKTAANPVTLAELAIAMGVQKQTANKYLQEEVKKGSIAVTGERNTGMRGRPAKLYLAVQQ